MNKLPYFLCVFLIFSCKTTKNVVYNFNKSAIGNNAMVVSAHPFATEIGLEVLKKGGNAVDAAIAVQYALAVVYPVAGNIGGGGFMIVRMKDGTTATLDFREQAPESAHRDMYLDAEKNVIKGLSTRGHLAAGVPGSVDGMFTAFEKFSKLKDMKTLIEPSIQLAKKGFPITQQQAENLNHFQDDFKELNTSMPVFVKNAVWKKGDLMKQEDLAATLTRIRDNGRSGFYEGKTAELIVSEMKAGNGIMTKADLKNYKSVWREPVKGKYKNYEIISMPPPSSGGIALLQLLGCTKNYTIDEWGFHSQNHIHLMAEIERRVYADRAQHLGDSDFYPVPQAELLNEDYLKIRMSDFDINVAGVSESVEAGQFDESEETTHYSIVDTYGNAVSVTTTINAGYGSKTVVSGAGFLLNNEMDDFSSKPGTPNFYGLIGAEANAIEPRKRMLSSMTPTIVTENDQLKMVIGTPGGSTIITSVYQVFLNVAEFGMTMTEAVQAKRVHHQWLPDQISYEGNGLSPTMIEGLKELGHNMKERGSIGRVDAILVREDGTLEGAADVRGDDCALGF